MAVGVRKVNIHTVVVLLSSGTATKKCYMDYFYSSVLFAFCFLLVFSCICKHMQGNCRTEQRLTQSLRFILITVRNEEIKESLSTNWLHILWPLLILWAKDDNSWKRYSTKYWKGSTPDCSICHIKVNGSRVTLPDRKNMVQSQRCPAGRSTLRSTGNSSRLLDPPPCMESAVIPPALAGQHCLQAAACSELQPARRNRNMWQQLPCGV